jgi:NADPH:quinone reductase-like Zn-dependent oxidoreductase
MNGAAAQIFKDVGAGRTTSVIAQTFSIDQADTALRLLETGGVVGKVVLVPRS